MNSGRGKKKGRLPTDAALAAPLFVFQTAGFAAVAPATFNNSLTLFS